MASLGPIREILVLSIATGLVLCALSSTGRLFFHQSFAADLAARLHKSKPVLNLRLDRDNNRLFVHSWPDMLDQIALETGVTTSRSVPQCLLSADASETNSTFILLTQFADRVRCRHEVSIVRGNDLVVSEELVLDDATTSDARVSTTGSTAVVVGHAGRIFAWDLSNPEPESWQIDVGHAISGACLSSDGCQLLVVTLEGLPTIVDLRSGTVCTTLGEIGSGSRSAAWSHDGRRVAIGNEKGGITVFDSSTGKEIWHHQLDLMFAKSLALSETGDRLAVGAFDKKIRVWNLSRPSDPTSLLAGDSSIVHNLIFTNSDENLISGSNDGTIREWSLADCRVIRDFR